jgi:hypothetical protein
LGRRPPPNRPYPRRRRRPAPITSDAVAVSADYDARWSNQNIRLSVTQGVGEDSTFGPTDRTGWSRRQVS